MKLFVFLLLIGSPLFANPLFTLNSSRSDIALSDGQLYVRDGNELFVYNGLGLKKIGKVAAEPFAFIPFMDGIITREGNELHRYEHGQWSKIGAVASEPFSWQVGYSTLITREGNGLHMYDGQDWEKIGAAKSPFEMKLLDGRLYTREGNEIHLYANGTWSKIGKVAKEPFSMTPFEDGLYTIEGEELYTYNAYSNKWDEGVRIERNSSLITSGRDGYVSLGGRRLMAIRDGQFEDFADLPGSGLMAVHTTYGNYFFEYSGELYEQDRYGYELRSTTSLSRGSRVTADGKNLYVLKGNRVYRYR